MRSGWHRSGSSLVGVARCSTSAWSPGVVIGIASALAATALVALPSSSAGAAVARPRAAQQGVSSRPDVVSARITARSQGTRIEVESLRSRTSSTWVNPNGSLTTEMHSAPIRFKDDHGDWRNVDLSLGEGKDGSLAPAGSDRGLHLFGPREAKDGKSGPGKRTAIASADAGSKGSVALGWTGTVPAPSVTGSTADYKEINKGVDLQVAALGTGFETLLSVDSAAAAKDSWTLPLTAAGVTPRNDKDGGISFLNDNNDVVSRLLPARTWDAARDKAGQPASVAPVAMSTAKDDQGRWNLMLTPEKGWLTDPDRVYPVTIDPTYTQVQVAPSFDTYVASNVSTDLSSASVLQAGSPDGTVQTRSFLSFPLASVQGKSIVSGSLSLNETGSGSCTASGVEVWDAGGASTSTRWNSQPTIGSSQGAASAAAGYSASCPATRISIPITNLVKTWAAGSASTGSLMVRASSETTASAFKTFSSSETANSPYLTFTYDQPPLASTDAPTFTPGASYGGASYTSGSKPMISVPVNDPDGDTLQGTIEIYNSTTVSAGSLVASCTSSAMVQPGQPISCAPATALADGTYYERTRATDGTLYGPWSSLTDTAAAFTVATAAPPLPTVACSGYPDGSWTSAIPGSAVSCTATTSASGGASAAGWVRYSIDGNAATYAAVTPGSTTTTTFTVPNQPGLHRLVARTQSRSNVYSTPVNYNFGLGTGAALAKPYNKLSASSAVLVFASAPPATGGATVTASLQYRIAGTSTWSTSAATYPTTSNSGGVSISGTWDPSEATTSRTPTSIDVQACFAYSTGTTLCSYTTTAVTIQRLPHAFGNGYPTKSAGPGTVAMLTGEFSTASTDVSEAGGTGTLSVARTQTTFAGPNDVVTGVFGPGWTTDLDTDGAGAAGLQVVDNTTVDGSIALTDGDGNALTFTQPGGGRVQDKTGTYTPVDQNTIDDTSTLKILDTSGTTTGTAAQIQYIEDDGTVTTWTTVAAPAAGTTTAWKPSTVVEAASNNTTTFSSDSSGRVTRLLTPTPTGVGATACPYSTGSGVTAMNAGCRALRIEYGTATTASASTPGDFTGRVKNIWLQAWDPNKAGGAGMNEIKLATYLYDTGGRLVSWTNSRTGLATTYGYDSTSSRLASLTPPGLAPYTFTYDSNYRLSTITRVNPTTIGGTATLARLFYNTPLTGSALPDVSTTAIGSWNQTSAPTYAAAMFGPDAPGMTTAPATTSSDWQYASLAYADINGYDVDDADYGAGAWQIGSTDYDTYGNAVRTLDPTATAALKSGTAQGSSDQLASLIRYNGSGDAITSAGQPTGTEIVDQWGPARWAEDDAGKTVWGRPHTHYTYDENAPNSDNAGFGFPYALVTSTVLGMADGTTGSTATTYTAPADNTTYATDQLGYAPIDGTSSTGATSGWTLGIPTVSTRLVYGSATNMVHKTRYDSSGRVVESRMPNSAGSDAGTNLTTYYQAGSGSGDSTCDSKPQWAGMVCRTYSAAAPTSGPTMPDRRVTAYTIDAVAATTTETSSSTVRTTSIAYDSAGRPSKTTLSVAGLSGSQDLPTRKITYNASTGLATALSDLNSSGVTTADVVTGYDTWGRIISYRDAAPGAVATTTAYDAMARLTGITDAQGTTSYGYGTDANGKTERRGMPTSLNVSGVGTFTGGYDGNGNLSLQTMPGSLRQTIMYDSGGQATSETYYGPDSGGNSISWVGWHEMNDAAGRVRRDDDPSGASFTGATGSANAHRRVYTYNPSGRLTEVRDRTNPTTGSLDASTSLCQTRVYAYDRDGNRSSYTVNAPTNTGGCTTTNPATTTTYSYDSADRIAGSGYTYDTLGRTASFPASDTPSGVATTLGYYTDDTIYTIAAGSSSQTFGVDPEGRRLTDNWTTSGTTTRTTTRHYVDDGDSPGWMNDTQGSTTTLSRYVQTLGGGLGAYTTSVNGGAPAVSLALANMHGDVNATITLPTSGNPNGIDSWNEYYEYGGSRAGTAMGASKLAYGWLGVQQRSADTISGFALMGARLYNSSTGRFSSLDPLSGGNENLYNYPNDPINLTDISGKCGCTSATDEQKKFYYQVSAYWHHNCQQWGCQDIEIKGKKKPSSVHIPLPSRNSGSAIRYANTLYMVYEIYYKTLVIRKHTWKYGITRVNPYDNRPQWQIPSCERLSGHECDWTRVAWAVGWIAARTWEADLIYLYAVRHGHCPPGQIDSCM